MARAPSVIPPRRWPAPSKRRARHACSTQTRAVAANNGRDPIRPRPRHPGVIGHISKPNLHRNEVLAAVPALTKKLIILAKRRATDPDIRPLPTVKPDGKITGRCEWKCRKASQPRVFLEAVCHEVSLQLSDACRPESMFRPKFHYLKSYFRNLKIWRLKIEICAAFAQWWSKAT